MQWCKSIHDVYSNNALTSGFCRASLIKYTRSLNEVLGATARHETSLPRYATLYIRYRKQDQNIQRPEDVLGNIAMQLIEDILENNRPISDEIFRVVQVWRSYLRPSMEVTRDQLIKLIVLLSEGFTETYLFLDGLDECDPELQLMPTFQFAEIFDLSGIRLFMICGYSIEVPPVFRYASMIDASSLLGDTTGYIVSHIDQYPVLSDLVKSFPEILTVIEEQSSSYVILYF